MVRYDGLFNPFHILNLSRLTHPTKFTKTTLSGNATDRYWCRVSFRQPNQRTLQNL